MTEGEAAAGKAAQNDPAAESDDIGMAGSEDIGAEAADEIESARAEAAENWNKYLRAVAEIDNLRKRQARDVENARRFGVERLAAGLLPVRDSLEAALKAAGDGGSVDVATLLEGDRATLALLDQALESAGIAEIDPEGEPFDPERHEAISMLPSDTVEPNSVLTVIQKGYELAGRLVRPARVVVARAPDETG